MGKLISRRAVLWGGVLTGATLAAGRLVWLSAPTLGMRVLSSREVDVVEALARVLFPPGQFSVAGGDGGTAPMVDVLLADYFPTRAVVGFRYLLKAVELGTVMSRGVSFSHLSSDEAAEVIDMWTKPQPVARRLASDGFKAMLGMAFFRRPEVLADIGWRLDCMGEVSG